MSFVRFPGCFSSVNGDDLSNVQPSGAPRPIQEDEIPDLICEVLSLSETTGAARGIFDFIERCELP